MQGDDSEGDGDGENPETNHDSWAEYNDHIEPMAEGAMFVRSAVTAMVFLLLIVLGAIFLISRF